MLQADIEFERLNREFGYKANEHLELGDGVFRTRKPHLSELSAFSDSVQGEIATAAESSWWYRVRNEMIVKTLKGRRFSGTLWDVGSGTGVVTAALVGAGIPAIAVEPSMGGTTIATQRGVISIQGTLQSLKLPDSCLDGIGAFDVLEHITNRQDFLQEITRVLLPGGHFIVTVPALRLLWSQADVDAKHYLRYSRRILRNELEMCGFEVLSVGYFFALIVPPLLLIRALPYRLGLRIPHSKNSALRASGGILGKLAGRIEVVWGGHAPFGSSLLAVARKTSQPS
ncbi:MAG: class I SAM-dependent methyltransferase [Ilumatobacteraceae bacterium]